MSRHSRVQIVVLGLYKKLLRAAEEKVGLSGQIKTEFRKNSLINRADIMKIEYLIRRGERQLEMLRKPSVSGARTVKLNIAKTID